MRRCWRYARTDGKVGESASSKVAWVANEGVLVVEVDELRLVREGVRRGRFDGGAVSAGSSSGFKAMSTAGVRGVGC